MPEPEVLTRASMEEVVVNKDKLRETLQANLVKHRQIFDEALEGYQKRSIELLEQHIDRIRKGKVEKIIVSLPIPEDHTDDYEKALLTLDWTVFNEVVLSIREFDMYVRDNWAWKNEFITNSSMYTAVTPPSAKNTPVEYLATAAAPKAKKPAPKKKPAAPKK